MRVELFVVPYDSGVRADGGLRLSDVHDLLAEIARAFHVRAVAITAYDPGFDDDGRVCEAAIGLILALACAVEADNASV